MRLPIRRVLDPHDLKRSIASALLLDRLTLGDILRDFPLVLRRDWVVLPSSSLRPFVRSRVVMTPRMPASPDSWGIVGPWRASAAVPGGGSRAVEGRSLGGAREGGVRSAAPRAPRGRTVRRGGCRRG
jgi:hypothetical protein